MFAASAAVLLTTSPLLTDDRPQPHIGVRREEPVLAG